MEWRVGPSDGGVGCYGSKSRTSETQGWFIEPRAQRLVRPALIDTTTTPSGKLVFGVFGLMAEFERDMLRQRTNAGLAAARKRGHFGGRPRSIDAAAIKKARVMLSSGDYSKAEVAAEPGVSRHTLWRELARQAPP